MEKYNAYIKMTWMFNFGMSRFHSFDFTHRKRWDMRHSPVRRNCIRTFPHHQYQHPWSSVRICRLPSVCPNPILRCPRWWHRRLGRSGGENPIWNFWNMFMKIFVLQFAQRCNTCNKKKSCLYPEFQICTFILLKNLKETNMMVTYIYIF